MDEAERLCDRLLVLDHGRKIAEGTPRDLIAEHLEPRRGRGLRRRRARRWPSAACSAAPQRVEISGETVFFYTQRCPQPLLDALAGRSAAALPAPAGQPRGPVPQAHRPPDPRRRLMTRPPARSSVAELTACPHTPSGSAVHEGPRPTPSICAAPLTALVAGVAAQPAGLAQARDAQRDRQHRRAADHAGRLRLRPGCAGRAASTARCPTSCSWRRGSICMSAMNAATFEALYSAFSRMHVQKTWDGIMNAPVGARRHRVGRDAVGRASRRCSPVTAILVVMLRARASAAARDAAGRVAGAGPRRRHLRVASRWSSTRWPRATTSSPTTSRWS